MIYDHRPWWRWMVNFVNEWLLFVNLPPSFYFEIMPLALITTNLLELTYWFLLCLYTEKWSEGSLIRSEEKILNYHIVILCRSTNVSTISIYHNNRSVVCTFKPIQDTRLRRFVVILSVNSTLCIIKRLRLKIFGHLTQDLLKYPMLCS